MAARGPQELRRGPAGHQAPPPDVEGWARHFPQEEAEGSPRKGASEGHRSHGFSGRHPAGLGLQHPAYHSHLPSPEQAEPWHPPVAREGTAGGFGETGITAALSTTGQCGCEHGWRSRGGRRGSKEGSGGPSRLVLTEPCPQLTPYEPWAGGRDVPTALPAADRGGPELQAAASAPGCLQGGRWRGILPAALPSAPKPAHGRCSLVTLVNNQCDFHHR